ncbi:NAD-dependent epimerase/dehydratase family protein [Flavobacteriaceae bacterium]|nr:NAD-dependent epimerase/dehydratase family protein [Flavobacteriaceae bacterium]
MKILVTGAAGFIGYHLVKSLVESNHEVIGLDNINNYYNVDLKFDRLNELGISRDSAIDFLSLCNSNLFKNFKFIRMNLEDRVNLPIIFKNEKFDVICNLAAQAGVRYSIENPETYIDSNIVGFLNVLECCRNYNIKKIVYASSSSIYGNNEKVPFNELDNTDKPISLYAATKKSNELIAHTYSHLFKINTIGLRFFTVYGSWGRPDMAYYLFANAIVKNSPIKVYNNGDLSRDFTHIDDIVIGIKSVLLSDSSTKKLYQLYNIGNNNPVVLTKFIEIIEKYLDKKAIKKMLPMQDGDVKKTWASISKIEEDYNFKNNVSLDFGIREFISWFKTYNKIEI